MRPFVPNPAPVTVAVEIWTRDPPVLLRVAECVCGLPTGTLPNAMLAGFEASAPTVTPVPDSGMFSEGLEALLEIATLPVTLPAAAGANLDVNDVLWPPFRVMGRLAPVRLIPVPLADAWVMVTLDDPPFVTVMVCTWLFPS